MTKTVHALASILLLAACTEKPVTPTVRGRLMGYDGAPLAGAHVSL